MSDMKDIARSASSWPFNEARRLLKRLGGALPDKGHVLFETGFGASGLPHIGTFGEVVRTSMVRHAFATLTGWPTRLICFSDDMDGLRKVPDNVPNRDMLAGHLGKPLTDIPDPFGTADSFGGHNNARFRAFLDRFGFEAEFLSSTDCYRSGRFDETLLAVAQNYDSILDVVLPTLGAERQKTYSPFLPVSPATGRVLQVPVTVVDADKGLIRFRDEDGEDKTVPVTGGNTKLQWKVDWAMRWRALGVDYEMAGKDLIESVNLSGKIVRILGGRAPEGFSYELFLDENGEKISKSRGNGISLEEWLAYASPETLSYYMFQKPRSARKLYFDIIPKTVDEYWHHRERYPDLAPEKRLDNPLWHVHEGDPPEGSLPVSFPLLLNLVGTAHTDDKALVWKYVSSYAPEASPETHPALDDLIEYAIQYYRDFVAPEKAYRAPDDREKAALHDLLGRLEKLPADADGETIQTEIYSVGKEHGFEPLRAWFQALYEILLGQSQGPRMGNFMALYGLGNSLALIREKLKGTE